MEVGTLSLLLLWAQGTIYFLLNETVSLYLYGPFEVNVKNQSKVNILEAMNLKCSTFSKPFLEPLNACLETPRIVLYKAFTVGLQNSHKLSRFVKNFRF